MTLVAGPEAANDIFFEAGCPPTMWEATASCLIYGRQSLQRDFLQVEDIGWKQISKICRSSVSTTLVFAPFAPDGHWNVSNILEKGAKGAIRTGMEFLLGNCLTIGFLLWCFASSHSNDIF